MVHLVLLRLYHCQVRGVVVHLGDDAWCCRGGRSHQEGGRHVERLLLLLLLGGVGVHGESVLSRMEPAAKVNRRSCRHYPVCHWALVVMVLKHLLLLLLLSQVYLLLLSRVSPLRPSVVQPVLLLLLLLRLPRPRALRHLPGQVEVVLLLLLLLPKLLLLLLEPWRVFRQQPLRGRLHLVFRVSIVALLVRVRGCLPRRIAAVVKGVELRVRGGEARVLAKVGQRVTLS